MRVFARVDRCGRPAFAEKYGGRLGPRGYRALGLSAQNVYAAEDVEKMLEAHVRCDGNIDTVFLEFEDEQIPVCNQGELRLVARLAAAYHNSLVHKNLGTKPDDADADAREAASHASHASHASCASYTSYASCAALSDIATVDDVSTVFHSLESGGSRDSEWDESEYGDRCYNDQEFEMNEDLGQPWLETGEAAEERWGIWG